MYNATALTFCAAPPLQHLFQQRRSPRPLACRRIRPTSSLSGLSPDARFALDAVSCGSRICLDAAHDVQTGGGVHEKEDTSPVTCVDYSIQALVAHRLSGGVLLAEEDARGFARLPTPLQERTAALARLSVDEVHSALVSHRQGYASRGPAWVCDPVDGTLGLVGDAAYAIGLSRVPDDVDVAAEVAALALPARKLVLLVDDGALSVVSLDTSFKAVKRVETGKSPSARSDGASKWHFSPASEPLRLTGLPPPTEVCCGSLVKYAEVAMGVSDAFVQSLPEHRGYSWDHLAGIAAVVASGGQVSDLSGGTIQLGITGGRQGLGFIFVNAPGIVATAKDVDHGRFCELAQQALN